MRYLELQRTFWSWNTIRCRWVCIDRSQHLEDSSNVQIISWMLHQLWDPREEYLENYRGIDGCQKLNTSTKSVYLTQLSVVSVKSLFQTWVLMKKFLFGAIECYIHSCFISSVSRSERDSWMTETSKAIIIAVRISERKASQRRREVFC